MPHVIQPGGSGGKMRVHYSGHRKRGLIAAYKRKQAEGLLLRAAAEELCVSAANLSRWALQGLSKIDRLDKILRSKKTGPVSQLKAIEDALLCYIFELCEQGVEINMLTVVLVLRASFILPEFRTKSFTARCSCVKRFMYAHFFSYRMGTHTSQRLLFRPKLKARPLTSCNSCASSSAVAIATGVSSSTWTKRRTILQ